MHTVMHDPSVADISPNYEKHAADVPVCPLLQPTAHLGATPKQCCIYDFCLSSLTTPKSVLCRGQIPVSNITCNIKHSNLFVCCWNDVVNQYTCKLTHWEQRASGKLSFKKRGWAGRGSWQDFDRLTMLSWQRQAQQNGAAVIRSQWNSWHGT